MGYRQDGRDEETFRRDIKKSTIAEGKILRKWLDYLERETGIRPDFRDNGCDNSGKLLSDQEVNAAADYAVDGYGLVEVKFSYPKLERFFHLKVGQVRRILKDKAYLLFANGWRTRNPTFCLVSPERLRVVTQGLKEIPWQGFGGKMSYRISVKRFRWKPFNEKT